MSNKINVAALLKIYNGLALDKGFDLKLSCKTLASIVGVTPASISNLSTSSKFDLLYSIAMEINDYFYPVFLNCDWYTGAFYILEDLTTVYIDQNGY